MATTVLKPAEMANYDEDRRGALYGVLVTLLIVNTAIVVARSAARYMTDYKKKSWKNICIFPEDPLIILSAVFVNFMLGNLLAATSCGLGLHSWRINAEDPNMPQNLATVFKHVWIVMILTGPTFSFIKLTLLFFYRRIFLVNQKWFRVAWWANLVYVVLWLFGATGFYIFQCWPVQWYFIQYYSRYHVEPPYPIKGQCKATTTINVALPLIFGLFSDISTLLLPIFTISKLMLPRRTKLGLICVFSLGAIACALDVARIVELSVETDDKVDPSYGVVVFLILTAFTEVAAIMCACLPIIVPKTFKEVKVHRRRPGKISRESMGKGSNKLRGTSSSYPYRNQRFRKLKGSSVEDTNQLPYSKSEVRSDSVALKNIDPTKCGHVQHTDNNHIVVENEFEVSYEFSAPSSERGRHLP